MKFEWGPPVTAPPEPSLPANGNNHDTSPATLGSDDVGDIPADVSATVEQPDQPSNSASDNNSQLHPNSPPPPEIPDEQPETTQQVNAVLRSLATWLGRALMVLGAAYELDPRVELVLAAIKSAIWLADYVPKIFSYLDAPKTLSELQNAAIRPAPPGYEIHHIVEAQKGSDNPQSNAQNFPDLIDSRENLVRIPYWKHVEISSWYSTINEDYNGLSPRDYLRGKNWEEQYEIGLKALRKFGVLK